MANHTILLIDYEPRSIERFRQPLVGAGYSVEIATDGISGIEAFTRLNPDMVLVEAMIPKKHGFEVCQELKRTPHGRRTPIIITTGVYKGRKYRTQALHIYGCDEYIEKPIAAEQLLAIVERFLGGSASSAREPVAAAVEANDADATASTEAPRVASEPAPSRHAPPKQNTIPKAVVGDLTEDEIMARLDAILPGAAPEMTAAPTMIAMAPEPLVADELPASIDLSPDAASTDEADPFGRMQAELTAELGSLSAALALEPAPVLLEPLPEPMASDQAASPSLLEALPEPDMPAPLPVEAPGPAAAPTPGQVVNFDVKRSRKNKKAGKKSQGAHGESDETSLQAPKAEAPARHPSRANEMRVPSGSLVETALETPRRSRGIPAWIWIALAAVALAALYFVFLRDDAQTAQFDQPRRPASVPKATPPPEEVETQLAEVEPPPAETPALPAPPVESKLVLNAVGARPTKAAPKATTKASDAPELRPAPAPAVSVPPEAALAAPVAIEEVGAGVEAIANTAEPEPKRPATLPGTLVDIAEADTEPVSLSRKLPVYSMQARQLRLQGAIVMRVLVNENGAVDQVVLVSGIGGGDLNDAAMKAAKQWTYRPATKDGVPVKVWKIEQVAFKL